MLALLIIVTVLGAAIGTGFCVAGIFFPGFIVKDGEGTPTARVFAYYGAARSVALLLVILLAAFRADANALVWLGLLSGIIQLIDAAVGTQTGKQYAVWGPLGVGAVQLLVVLIAAWLL
ncbi:hypothetical protein [Devosia sp. SL43]|uniref:hypothetical protein n=1 Tax=Devosia sp. SL43 TaxID=2806348 RepID=UPI001F21E1EA|nr:hypothetical protein [Devosia sp. SL43]UJW84055.1 hypothetical protein IM737_11365 [Devosia sp. SL43]